MRKWLRVLRLEKELSQAQVANRANISPQFYSYIEAGDRRPSPAVAKKISEVLGFSSEWYRLLDEKADGLKIAEG